MTARPRVFLSYSHDDEAHETLVRRFAEFLHGKLGMEVHVDQWADGVRIDWSRWALRQLKAADYTLAIASPMYRRRADGDEAPHVGRGSQFEGAILRDQLTGDVEEYTARILPVVLPGHSIEEIPQFLNPHTTTHYRIRRLELEDNGVGALIRAIVRRSEHGPSREDQPLFVDPRFTQVPKPKPYLLTDRLRPVSKGPDVRLGSAVIDGTHYGHSILYRCSMFCSEPRGVADFDLGRKFRRFRVIAGVLDDAADTGQQGHFEVFLDGVARGSVTARLGAPEEFDLDVSEVLRLRLVAYRRDTTAHPMLAGARIAGGLSNGLPELGWGDPTLHT